MWPFNRHRKDSIETAKEEAIAATERLKRALQHEEAVDDLLKGIVPKRNGHDVSK